MFENLSFDVQFMLDQTGVLFGSPGRNESEFDEE